MGDRWLTTILGVLCVALVSVVGLLGCRSEAKFPTKPVTVVAFTAAGSSVDSYARETSRLAEKGLGVTVNVENRTGGSGIVALSHVKSQPADGYLAAAISTSVTYSMVMPGAAAKPEDFQCVIRGVDQPSAFIVKTDGKYKTLKDVIDYAKTHPGEIKVAVTGGAGFNTHALDNWTRQAGVKLTQVSFEGGNEGALAVLGGHVDAVQMAPPAAIGQLREGKLKAIAVSTEKRVDYLPDAPTYKEQGIDLVRLFWYGLLAKKGTPADAIKTLHDGFMKGREDPSWNEYLKKTTQGDAYMSSEDFQKAFDKDVQDSITYMKEIGQIK